MLCNKCHKNLATVRYAEVVDGQVTDINLCARCLAAHQEQTEDGFGLATGVPAPGWGTGSSLESEIMDAEISCASCGMRVSSVLVTGKVGCMVCYREFADRLEPLLEGIHIGMRHHGKMPVMDDMRTRLRSDLQSKRALLRSAVGAENYEEAIELRDEIKRLEDELGPFQEPCIDETSPLEKTNT